MLDFRAYLSTSHTERSYVSESEWFRQCVPICSLGEANFQVLLEEVAILELGKNDLLFKEGDADSASIFLLEGVVELTSRANKAVRTIESGSETARYAIAQLKPRQFTGKALSTVKIASVDSLALDRILAMNQMSDSEAYSGDGIEVSEVSGDFDSEWMIELMRRDTFQQLPAEHFTEVFSRFEECEVDSGEAVIRQGEPGDYYYIIREGSFSVSRKSADGKIHVLAKLVPGDVFGEEALISNAPRNASVIAMENCRVMRLAKSDFDELLKPSLTKMASHAESEQLLKKGAGLIDVRTEDEFAQGALKVAKNIPLYRLRRVLSGLDPGRKYVLCCQTGLRSSVAAFLMSQRGYEVYVLQGGLQSLRKAAGS